MAEIIGNIARLAEASFDANGAPSSVLPSTGLYRGCGGNGLSSIAADAPATISGTGISASCTLHSAPHDARHNLAALLGITGTTSPVTMTRAGRWPDMLSKPARRIRMTLVLGRPAAFMALVMVGGGVRLVPPEFIEASCVGIFSKKPPPCTLPITIYDEWRRGDFSSSARNVAILLCQYWRSTFG